MEILSSNDSPAIAAVKQQFEQWRNSRVNRREPIPQELWQAAVELCKTHSIAHVSRSLRLSYTELKKRIPPARCPATEIQFMQLDAGSFASQWHLQCDRSDGGRLQISGSGQLPDIETMLGVFLS